MLFLLLSAEFVAAAQVSIYAGAIIVMFLFVTAYLGGTPTPRGPAARPAAIAAVAAAFAILVEVIVVICSRREAPPDPGDVSGAFGSPAAIGELFLTDHLLAFEVTSVVLLVAAVGGVILGSHARRADEGEV